MSPADYCKAKDTKRITKYVLNFQQEMHLVEESAQSQSNQSETELEC